MSVRIEADVSEAVKLVGDLDDAAEALTTGVARAVNMTAAKVRTDSVRLVTSQVNLPEQYVDDRIEIAQEATPDNPVAIISAPMRGTMLTRFGARVAVQPNAWTEADFIAKFGKNALVRPTQKAPKLPWTPRRGDPLRGIPAGAKSAGVSVSVKAGSGVKNISYAFVMPVRAGRISGGNGEGVFARPKGGGKPKALYGPSVDQVVRGVWRDIEGDVAAELSQEILTEVSVEVEQRLK